MKAVLFCEYFTQNNMMERYICLSRDCMMKKYKKEEHEAGVS